MNGVRDERHDPAHSIEIVCNTRIVYDHEPPEPRPIRLYLRLADGAMNYLSQTHRLFRAMDPGVSAHLRQLASDAVAVGGGILGVDTALQRPISALEVRTLGLGRDGRTVARGAACTSINHHESDGEGHPVWGELLAAVQALALGPLPLEDGSFLGFLASRFGAPPALDIRDPARVHRLDSKGQHPMVRWPTVLVRLGQPPSRDELYELRTTPENARKMAVRRLERGV